MAAPTSPLVCDVKPGELHDRALEREHARAQPVVAGFTRKRMAVYKLAVLVGAHLRKPAEAKRVVRNVFVAPGDVVVSPVSVTVKLAPAGTRTEFDAIAAMLDDVNARRLSLPGDRAGRRVRFQLQT